MGAARTQNGFAGGGKAFQSTAGSSLQRDWIRLGGERTGGGAGLDQIASGGKLERQLTTRALVFTGRCERGGRNPLAGIAAATVGLHRGCRKHGWPLGECGFSRRTPVGQGAFPWQTAAADLKRFVDPVGVRKS